MKHSLPGVSYYQHLSLLAVEASPTTDISVSGTLHQRSSFIMAVTSMTEAVVCLSALSIPRTPLAAPLSRDGRTLPTEKGDQFDNVPARISATSSSGLQDNMAAHSEIAKTVSSPQYAITSGLGP